MCFICHLFKSQLNSINKERLLYIKFIKYYLKYMLIQ